MALFITKCMLHSGCRNWKCQAIWLFCMTSVVYKFKRGHYATYIAVVGNSSRLFIWSPVFFNIGIWTLRNHSDEREKKLTAIEKSVGFGFKSLRSRPWKFALSNGWAVFQRLESKLADSDHRFNQENLTIFGWLWPIDVEFLREGKKNDFVNRFMPMLPVKQRTHRQIYKS